MQGGLAEIREVKSILLPSPPTLLPNPHSLWLLIVVALPFSFKVPQFHKF